MVRKLYSKLEDVINKYVARPLAIVGLAGILGYVDRLYSNDIQVNSRTEGWQSNPAVAMDREGNFAITWYGQGDDPDMPNGYGIFAQRFDKEENKVGEEFQVNNYVKDSQVLPSIAMNDNGDFIIIWEGFLDSGVGVSGQRFGREGNRIDKEFLVRNYASNSKIAMNDNGFVITYQREDDIFAQRFDRNGNRIGDEIYVNTFRDDEQNYPNVTMNDNGDFIIAWYSYPEDLFAQRFDRDGNKVGNEFLVGRYGVEGSHPALASNDDGEFIIAGSDSDNNRLGIFAQRFDSAGNEIGKEFQVNSFESGWQWKPDLAMNNNGDIVITWESWDRNESGRRNILAQRYTWIGNRIGEEFYIGDGMLNPAIAMNDNGYFAITWTGNYDIFAKIFHFDGDIFKRGDSNRDNKTDLSDAIHSLEYLFKGGKQPYCLDAADTNDDGDIDISDPVYLLFHLFRDYPMPHPYPNPGRDETKDNLGCGGYEPTL